MASKELGGLLLTGGASSRMGVDKATIEVDGSTIGQKSADLLAAVVTLALEVGPGFTDLVAVREAPPRQGPLAGIVAGRRALIKRGLSRSASCIVLACDLPLLNSAILEVLSSPPRGIALVPLIDNIAQPLCARWSTNDLDEAERRFEAGERSLRLLPNPAEADMRSNSSWGDDAVRLSDADSPDDLATLISWAKRRT